MQQKMAPSNPYAWPLWMTNSENSGFICDVDQRSSTFQPSPDGAACTMLAPSEELPAGDPMKTRPPSRTCGCNERGVPGISTPICQSGLPFDTSTESSPKSVTISPCCLSAIVPSGGDAYV